PAHKSILVRNFLAKNSTNLVLQATRDFFFSRSKQSLRGCHFEPIEATKRNSLNELKPIPETKFRQCSVEWKKR
ncbi:hypothetical protein WH47_12318, partial [Habropoda laboriosa]